jgi:capsular polysaccharide export protein
LAGAASVHKVNFNGGDQFFYARGAIRYRGTMEAWPSALSRLMSELQIDTVFLFGDCREIHRPVQAIARERGAEVWVFEEGYVRPDFVTLERSGVNNHSPAPRDPAFYNALPDMSSGREACRQYVLVCRVLGYVLLHGIHSDGRSIDTIAIIVLV